MVSHREIAAVVSGVSMLTMLAVAHGRVVEPVRAASARPQAAAPAAQPDEGAQTFRRVCIDCHDTDRILSTRRNKVGWEEVLDEMSNKGATASDKEWSVVLDYLLRQFGRVNVNRAPAPELALILGLTDEQAAAVVSYRTDHGLFMDFDSVTKVPGLDAAKLTQERDAITF